MLTIFSAPKSFSDPHIALIQRNAISSWLQLGEEVEVLLLGDEPGLDEAASSLGVRRLRVPERAPSGTPLISALFRRAREAASYRLLCYMNADIIPLDDFLPGVRTVVERLDSFLIVGTRWDLSVQRALSFEKNWIQDLRQRLELEGQLHPPMGSDYFIFPVNRFERIPDFALGRAGWDNWMIFQARQGRTPVVDASSAITVVHQDHSYAHLPGGQPHYRHPESIRNVELAGGLETMFRLRDADWMLVPSGLERKSWDKWEWPRKIEADWIALLGPGRGAQMVRMAFHPKDTLTYFWRMALNSLRIVDQDGDEGKRGG
jgi:hypothetical protein